MTTTTGQRVDHQAAAVAVRATDLMVVLRTAQNGPEVAAEPIRAADLQDIHAELWRDGWLRAGRPDVPLEDVALQLTARRAGRASDRCELLTATATDSHGRSYSIDLSADAFEPIATRVARSLQVAGVLQAADLYVYEMVLRRQRPIIPLGQQAALTVTAQRTPLRYLTVPMAPLRARAKTVGTIAKWAFPVFFTADAMAMARQLAHRGADHEPPTETGGVLIGPLCSCPESGEFYVVIAEVLEAKDADGAGFSLSYTDKTWARIQTIVRLKQSQHQTRAHRMVGQTHGHNFLPGSACGACSKVTDCRLTSVFVSTDDQAWSQAVFHRQPWHVCQIYGFNARGKYVHGMFTLRENRLQQRGFYVLPDFDPGADGGAGR